MRDMFLGLAVVGSITIFLAFTFNCFWTYFDNRLALDKCERENNVYECELVAKPKEEKEGA